VTLAETLIGKGYELRIHDPAVNLARLIGSNKRFIEETIPHIESMLTDDLDTVLAHADVLVVGQGRRDLVERLQAVGRSGQKVIDLVGVDGVSDATELYEGVCW